MRKRIMMLMALAAVGLVPISAVADDCQTSEPTGKVILELSFLNDGSDEPYKMISFDREGFDKLPQRSFRTNTIWTNGEQEFSGVGLKSFLNCFDIEDGLVKLTAANEYFVEIETKDVREDGALIASRRNGNPMSRRDKGPLWLVYAYDMESDFRTETIYAQSIWQLDRIVVSP